MATDTKFIIENKSFEFLISPRFRVYRHLSLLTILIAFVLSIEPTSKDLKPDAIKVRFFIFFVSLLYTNMYLLVPKYLFKSKPTHYIVGILLCGSLAYSLIFLIGYQKKIYLGFYGDRSVEHMELYLTFSKFIFITLVWVAASTAIKLFQRWITDSQRIMELEHLTNYAELEQLKNQINPHFLFNMLNNANVLTQKDPEKASHVLIKLSDFLRYQLYDSARSKVLLTSEIHFLNDFLNLEKIRRDNFQFTISKEGALTGVQVAPLLFITFLENAVKHSLDAENSSYVDVEVSVHSGKLYFKCVNSKPKNPILIKEVGGLGLENIKRRLILLYPDKHVLTVDENKENYIVHLMIQL